MVDFKKKNQEIWEEKTEEERVEILYNRRKMKDAILERVDFDLIRENIKDAGRLTKCTAILKIDEENRLKFEVVDRHFRICGDRSYYGYFYDKHFVNKVLKSSDLSKFTFDAGADIGLNMLEMKNIVKVLENARLNKGLLLNDDYFPIVTELCKGTKLE